MLLVMCARKISWITGALCVSISNRKKQALECGALLAFLAGADILAEDGIVPLRR